MRKTIGMLLAAVLLFSLAGVSACAADGTGYGTAGGIGDEERAPDADDYSHWLTLRAGDCGVRIVTKDGGELVAADNYGGIYLNGDVYLNGQPLEQALSPKPEYFNVANGFFYLLLVASLAMNIYCVARIRKRG